MDTANTAMATNTHQASGNSGAGSGAVEAGDSARLLMPGSKAVVIVFAILLSALSVVSAFQAAADRTYPAAAASLWPTNGWAKAAFARQFLSIEAGSQNAQLLPSPTDERFFELSREALLSEPLAADAVRNLGLHYASIGDTDRARTLLVRASSLTRRDALTNLWLSQDYALRGDDEKALETYDHLMRTNTRSRAVTLPVLAQTLAQENGPNAFYGMLATDPIWQNDFWVAVIQDGSALRNAAELRTRLHGTTVDLIPSHDSRLLAQLVDAGLMDEAFALFEAVAPSDVRRDGQMLRDPGFDQRPQFSPFEWLEIAEPDYGSNVVADAGVLRISALEGASGVVTEQLVRLESGEYKLSIEARNGGQSQLAEGIRFSSRLACAEELGARTFEQVRDLGNDAPATFDVSGTCDVFWLSLAMNSDSRMGLDVEVDTLSLTRRSS